MKARYFLAGLFILIATVFGILFFFDIEFPQGIKPYFKKEYYGQFGPLVISIELLTAGIYLWIKHSKTNFVMGVFAFTALLDPIFNLTGLFTSQVPQYATITFVLCGIAALIIAFTNAFELGKISWKAAFGSFLTGTAVELFFNYL